MFLYLIASGSNYILLIMKIALTVKLKWCVKTTTKTTKTFNNCFHSWPANLLNALRTKKSGLDVLEVDCKVQLNFITIKHMRLKLVKTVTLIFQ